MHRLAKGKANAIQPAGVTQLIKVIGTGTGYGRFGCIVLHRTTTAAAIDLHLIKCWNPSRRNATPQAPRWRQINWRDGNGKAVGLRDDIGRVDFRSRWTTELRRNGGTSWQGCRRGRKPRSPLSRQCAACRHIDTIPTVNRCRPGQPVNLQCNRCGDPVGDHHRSLSKCGRPETLGCCLYRALGRHVGGGKPEEKEQDQRKEQGWEQASSDHEASFRRLMRW